MKALINRNVADVIQHHLSKVNPNLRVIAHTVSAPEKPDSWGRTQTPSDVPIVLTCLEVIKDKPDRVVGVSQTTSFPWVAPERPVYSPPKEVEVYNALLDRDEAMIQRILGDFLMAPKFRVIHGGAR